MRSSLSLSVEQNKLTKFIKVQRSKLVVRSRNKNGSVECVELST